jgi:hypothetical protein
MLKRLVKLQTAAWCALLAGGLAGTDAGAQATGSAKASLIVVVGAGGEEEFGRAFRESAGRWEKAGAAAGAGITMIGMDAAGPVPDRERLQKAFAAETREGLSELWIVLIGHGTFDGKEAKFNLRGADVSAGDLSDWLKPFHRPLAIIDTASASGPFLAKLSATNRVVITATRSGHEVNYARFGIFLSESIADPAADLDKDGQVSLLEAFLTASQRTAEYYSGEGRLATEHALLDDNGDGLGTPPEWFRGVRAIKRAKDGAMPDGLRAHQFHLIHGGGDAALSAEARARRDELELAVARLRDRKAALEEVEYYRQLEGLLVEMARLYEAPARP